MTDPIKIRDAALVAADAFETLAYWFREGAEPSRTMAEVMDASADKIRRLLGELVDAGRVPR